MLVWIFLENLVKLTPSSADDKILQDLKIFFINNSTLREKLISIFIRGYNNKFDVKDEIWTSDIISLIFDIARAKFDKIN